MPIDVEVGAKQFDQAEIARRGTAAWNSWRKSNPGVPIDLRGAQLSAANLEGADLHCANLAFANLSAAKLARADLSSSILLGTRLDRADVSSANLSHANLIATELSLAKLEMTRFSYALLFKAIAKFTSFSLSDLSNAVISNDSNVSLERKRAIEFGTIYFDRLDDLPNDHFSRFLTSLQQSVFRLPNYIIDEIHPETLGLLKCYLSLIPQYGMSIDKKSLRAIFHSEIRAFTNNNRIYAHIYVSHSSLEDAEILASNLHGFLSALGYEDLELGEWKEGSWWARIGLPPLTKLQREKVKARAKLIEDALFRQQSNEAAKVVSDAAASLIIALRDQPGSAVVDGITFLFVKIVRHDGNADYFIKSLTAKDRAYIDSYPGVLQDPAMVLKEIGPAESISPKLALRRLSERSKSEGEKGRVERPEAPTNQ